MSDAPLSTDDVRRRARRGDEAVRVVDAVAPATGGSLHASSNDRWARDSEGELEAHGRLPHEG